MANAGKGRRLGPSSAPGGDGHDAIGQGRAGVGQQEDRIGKTERIGRQQGVGRCKHRECDGIRLAGPTAQGEDPDRGESEDDDTDSARVSEQSQSL